MKMFIMKHVLIICYFKTAGLVSRQQAVTVMLLFDRSSYEVVSAFFSVTC
jgi:hypothetical protein